MSYVLFSIYAEERKTAASVVLPAPHAHHVIKALKEKIMTDELIDNRDSYITIDHFATVRFEEKKSVFYGWASPVSSEKDAIDLIRKAKSQYPDAKHHVYGWHVCGKIQQNKYSDDGEPVGTAGLPVFDVLRKNHIEDGIIIVIRYFGGILLGGGGLVRAYTNTAVQALKEALPVIMRRYISYSLIVDYSCYEKIKRSLSEPDFYVEVKDYGIDIRAEVSCVENKKDSLHKIIADISNGKAFLELKEIVYKKSEPVILP